MRGTAYRRLALKWGLVCGVGLGSVVVCVGQPHADVVLGYPSLVHAVNNSVRTPTAVLLPGGVTGVVYRIVDYSTLLRRVDPSGTLLPGETDLAPGAPDAVVASAGNIIAVLSKSEHSCDSGDVRAQVFDGDGVALSAQVVVGPYAQGFSSIAIGIDGSGNFLGVYRQGGNDCYGGHFLGRAFDQDANPLGLESPIIGTYQVLTPTVAGLPGGGFVVAWQSETETLARRYDSTGATLGTPILVSPNGAQEVSDNPGRVDVEASSDGGFWIAWVVNAGTDKEVRLRKYDASGTPAGAEILVDSAVGFANPKLAVDVDGKVFLQWIQLDEHLVRGKLFAGDGTELSVETRLMTNPLADVGTPIAIGAGEFVAPSVTYNRDGITLCYSTNETTAIMLERFCSDDAANCTLCPGSSNDADADGDGVPDACDRCTVLDAGQQIAFRSFEFIERTYNSARPDRFRTRGSFVSSTPLAAFEPETQGLRVTMESADFGNVAIWTLAGGPMEPGGEGWRVDAARSKWVYRNLQPLSFCTVGINTLMLKHRASDPPGFLSFKMSGKKVPSGCLEKALTATDLPLTVSIAVANQAAAIDGACGEGSLEDLSCTFSGPTFEEICSSIEPIELLCR